MIDPREGLALSWRPFRREADARVQWSIGGVGLSSEFSRKVVIEPWPDGGVALDVRAEPHERAALAHRFGLLELTALEATGRLERAPGSAELRFHGLLEAAVVQECVVSLEPVPAQIRHMVERRYLRAEGQAPQPSEPGLATFDGDGDDEDEVELVHGRTIDLGEALAEELALALDPYPRAPEAAALVADDLGPYISFGAAEPAERPFASLRQLKEKRVR